MPRKNANQRNSRAQNNRSNGLSVKAVNSAVIPRGISAVHFPSGQKFVLKYSEQVVLNPATGAVAYHQFRANDMFDPNLTGTGHQPMGFDQIMAWYNHFAVVRSHIRVTASPPTLTGTNVAVWGVILTGSSTEAATLVGAGIPTITEAGWPFAGVGTTNSDKGWLTSQELTFDFQKFYSRQFNPNLSEFLGSTSASCTEQSYYTVWMFPWSSSVDPDACTFLVEIVYEAVFTEPVTLPAS
jgi:hypothetical protein